MAPLTRNTTDTVEEIRLPIGGSFVITDELGNELFRVTAAGDAVKIRGVAQSALVTPTATVADVAGTVPAGGTGAAAGGWDTSGHRDTAIATIAELKAQVNALLAALRTAGIVAAA